MGWRKKGEWYETTLLSASDLSRLFPDATIHRERMLGMTKSLMAVRGPRASSADATGPGESARPSQPPDPEKT